MEYINTQTMQYPVYEGDIRTEFKQAISWPKGHFSAPAPYLPVTPAAAPVYDPVTQTLTKTAQLQNGSWVQVWIVENKYQNPQDEAAAVAANFAAKKAEKKSQTDTEYEQRMVSGIVYNGLPVRSDDRSVINIIGANRNANASRKNVIGGQPVTITSQMAAALEATLTAYTDALGEKRYNLYVAIDAAADLAALAAIDTTSGWPSNTY